ncbi:Olfactory receptor 4F3/4F16/4F29 [Fukomys damarensis]|uniref:Olfactory receptor 4F3/4F16/4F29 n=1 Tax=Fukomys damarensis TaxID=885580 RepID=A0A091CXX7_FUKDA|nr:Olfactory receptor 4F3/4F16/4F29 [Fukomys damarensis]
MDAGNHSVVSEFFLMGLASSWEIQILLFLIFTIFYVASMLGNLLIVLTIISDHHLHSPLYFLLANLSFIDTGVSSIATPKMIYDLFRKYKVISLKGCITQMFFIHTVVQLAFVVNLPFCGANKMDSFYCDFPRFIKLACIDTYSLQFLIMANSGFISMGTFFILIVSYIFILVTVRKHSSGGLAKALSTLSAHITVVVFFFGPCIIVYVWPFPNLSIDKFLAIFYVIITPFLNPIIYTFRNKEMKMAMRRLFDKVLCFRKSP